MGNNTEGLLKNAVLIAVAGAFPVMSKGDFGLACQWETDTEFTRQTPMGVFCSERKG